MTARIANCFCTTLDNLTVPAELARQLRRGDDFIRLSVTAVHAVLAGRMAWEGMTGERIGLYLGTAFGPMQTNFDVLDQVVEAEPVSPTLFSHSVFNGAAGYIAAIVGIHGSSVTLTDFGFPFFRALQQGVTAIESQALDRCLVLQVETYSHLLLDAVDRQGGKRGLWPAGVACWLLEGEQCQGQAPFLLDHLEIFTGRAADEDPLGLRESVVCGGERAETCGYLGGVLHLTQSMLDNRRKIDACDIESLFGRVHLDIRTSEER